METTQYAPTRNLFLFLIFFLSLACCAPLKESEPVISPHPTARWVLACRVANTGFGCYPGDSAFTSRTGMALETLQNLGALDELTDRGTLIEWLRSRQQPDGGFLEQADFYNGKELPGGSQSLLEATYWAIRSLQLLGSEINDPEAAARFIHSKLSKNGGYDAYEYSFGGAPESLYTTYWALASLKVLGTPIPDSSKTVEWVNSMGDTKGNRGGYTLSNGNWKYSSPAGCYYALRCLELLGTKSEKREDIRRFLFSDYGQEPDGGFEVGHHQEWKQNHYSRTEDTFYSVASLELLGNPISDLDSSRAKRPKSDCVAWLSSVQNRDGGFARIGINEHTPLPSPSEMRPTWQAVSTLLAMGAAVPEPRSPIEPVSELKTHVPKYRHPCVDSEDPAEVWAYRRIALPIYNHFYRLTGSKLEAIGRLNRWASAAIGPHNAAWITQGRSILMHGWGQCGTMSWLLQQLVTSIDFPARASFIIADVNCEVLVQEKDWRQAHWCLYIPFTHEFPLPMLEAPDGQRNGWSVLDMVVDFSLREKNPSRPRPTRIESKLFREVKIELIDAKTGEFGETLSMNTSTGYDSPVVDKLYPGRSY
jgi:hypothetical protein